LKLILNYKYSVLTAKIVKIPLKRLRQGAPPVSPVWQTQFVGARKGRRKWLAKGGRPQPAKVGEAERPHARRIAGFGRASRTGCCSSRGCKRTPESEYKNFKISVFSFFNIFFYFYIF
jgi:hypothetical protein